MTSILNALQDVAAYVFGGTPSGGGTAITFSNSLLGKVVGAITASGNELLLVFAILALVGIGVGFFKRLTR